MSEIPAYQSIDYLRFPHGDDFVSLYENDKNAPLAGWYIYAPDKITLFPHGKAGIKTACPNEASEIAEFIDNFSKYGHYIISCWIHDNCWTPR